MEKTRMPLVKTGRVTYGSTNEDASFSHSEDEKS